MITLPPLNYALNALEPVISQNTLEFHHGKHHQAYVNNLNKLIEGTQLENASLVDIVKSSQGGIFNNAAQVWNHTFYFEQFNVNGKKEPGQRTADAIQKKFGSFENFKDEFSKSAATLFGSGWAWLVEGSNGIEILKESNAGTPLTKNLKPLLTMDVWEHAYYLDYQNKRPDYIAALWDIIDWQIIENRF